MSLILIFFALPHTLEDFATGESAKAGVPAPLLATVVSTIFAVQALGAFYWLGQKRRGVFSFIWALAFFGRLLRGWLNCPRF